MRGPIDVYRELVAELPAAVPTAPLWFALGCVAAALCFMARRRTPIRPISRWALVLTGTWVAFVIHNYIGELCQPGSSLPTAGWVGFLARHLVGASLVFLATAFVVRFMDRPAQPDSVPRCRAVRGDRHTTASTARASSS